MLPALQRVSVSKCGVKLMPKMSYNEDELEAPQWIDGDFMKKILESSGKGENVQIHHYDLTPATARGDHYASIMFRANILFATNSIDKERISVIIKTVPIVEGYKKDLLDSMNIFPKEMHIYKEVLSKCQEMLSKSGYSEAIAPRVLFMDSKPHDVIVFEDLKEQGYIMLPNDIPDEHESRLIFSKLAQYHALTFKMKAEGYDNMNFRGTRFGYSFTMKMDYFQTSVEFFTEALETIPEFEAYAKTIRKLPIDILNEKCVQAINRTPLYSVLNHGDLHSRNMMFRKNGFDVISEVIMVDFQAPHWGSPSYDLLYMGAGIPADLRKITFRHYFNVFSDTLVRVGFKGELPTFDQLEKELDAFIYVDLALLASISPFAYMDRDKLELGTVFTDKEARRQMYQSVGYIEHLKRAAPPILDRIALLD